MGWNLVTLFSIIAGGTAIFVGLLSARPPERTEPPLAEESASASTGDVSQELVFYGGLTGEVEVGRIRATPLPLEYAGDGEYVVDVPGTERPVYLSEPYAVVYFELVEMSMAHALIITDSAFNLRAGGRTYDRVMPRPVYPEGGWDAIFYRGAVAFESILPGSGETVTLEAPYSVDPGRPTAVILSSAAVEFPFSAFYPPGTLRTGQITGKSE
jgi:hypothetical protein